MFIRRVYVVFGGLKMALIGWLDPTMFVSGCDWRL